MLQLKLTLNIAYTHLYRKLHEEGCWGVGSLLQIAICLLMKHGSNFSSAMVLCQTAHTGQPHPCAIQDLPT